MNFFKSKSFGYSELACLYLPNLNKKSASNQFRNWINKNKQLKNALLEAGVQNRQKIFTPKQVQIIITYLGEP